MRDAALALLVLLALPVVARAETMTFHLSAREALASVDRYNAFLVSLGKGAKGVKLIPGGTIFADQRCAGFGTVFRLGSIAILGQPAVLAARVPSHNGKSAAALTAVFTAASVRTWTPPAVDAETSLPFWAAVPFGVWVTAEASLTGGTLESMATTRTWKAWPVRTVSGSSGTNATGPFTLSTVMVKVCVTLETPSLTSIGT